MQEKYHYARQLCDLEKCPFRSSESLDKIKEIETENAFFSLCWKKTWFIKLILWICKLGFSVHECATLKTLMLCCLRHNVWYYHTSTSDVSKKKEITGANQVHDVIEFRYRERDEINSPPFHQTKSEKTGLYKYLC